MVKFRGFKSKVFAIAFLASFITATTMAVIGLSAESPPLGTGADPNSSAACAVGFYANSTSETGGILGIICSQVGWTQLTGFPASCFAPGYFVTAIGASLTCNNIQINCNNGQTITIFNSGNGSQCIPPNWNYLVNFPTGCSAGQFVTGVGVTLTCNSVAWSQITSFPSGCGVNQFVIAVGTSLTCSYAVIPTCNATGNYLGANQMECNFNGNRWIFTIIQDCFGSFRVLSINSANNAVTYYTAGGAALAPNANVQFVFNTTGVIALANSISAGCLPTGTACTNYFNFNTLTWGTTNCAFTTLLSPYCFCAKLSIINSSAYAVDTIQTGNEVYRKVHNGSTDSSYFDLGIKDVPTFYLLSPQLVNYNSKTAQTAAVASFTTWGCNDINQIFEVDGDIDVTAFTSGTINLQVTYTDWNSGAQTITMVSSSALGDFPANDVTLMVKSGTTITIATTGTFVATYNVAASIKWVALKGSS